MTYGTFDGQGHTIHGIHISSTQQNFGLFRYHYGTIKGLTLSDATVEGGFQVGGIAAFGPGKIEDCHVTGSIKGSSGNVGGIIGAAASSSLITEDSHVKDCTFSGSVTGSEYVGGIVGSIAFSSKTYCYTIENCTVTSTMIQSQYQNIGGIVGGLSIYAATTVVKDCKVAQTTVTPGSGTARGAIMGNSLSTTQVNGCIYQSADPNLKGIGDNSDEGCTRVYNINAGEGVTVSQVSGTAVTIGDKAYYNSGATVTLGHDDREGYLFIGYSVKDAANAAVAVTDNSTFTLPASDVTVTAVWSDSADISVSGSEYTIKTARGWNAFCDLLANNAKGYFAGKTVKLANDIGTAQSPVTRMAGGRYHDFTGTFDGNKKTLYVRYGTSGSPVAENNAAPFRNVEDGCVIKNLHVAGDIYTAGKYAAGIAGTQYGTVTIRNCHSSVTIHSSVVIDGNYDGTHGGFLGNHAGGTLSITGCLFDGKMLTTNGTTNCGGFIGWCNSATTIADCLYAPAAIGQGETEVSATGSCTFYRKNKASVTITNCYYTRALGSTEGQGTQARTIKAAENVTVDFSAAATSTYDANGIAAYAKGLKYNDMLYVGNGDQVSLTLANTPPADKPYFWGYTVTDGGILAGTQNPYTLTMPDTDVEIGATFAVQPPTFTYDGVDTYTIWDAAGMGQFSDAFNAGETFSGKTVRLADNIDMSGIQFTPIGNSSHYFMGHFDGQGHTITGLTVTTDGQYGGLFGYIRGGQYNGTVENTIVAMVHDVVLQNPTITLTAGSSEQYAGTLVGYAGDCSHVYDNTVIGGTVTYTGGKNYNTNNSYAGGVVGSYNPSNLPKLSGNKVVGTTVSGGGVCGGLVGYLYYNWYISSNAVEASVSSAEYDLHTDIHTYGYCQGAIVGYCRTVTSTSGTSAHVNYYYSADGLTAYGAKPVYHTFDTVADDGYVAPLYTITVPADVTVSSTPTVVLSTDYYAAGTEVTLSNTAPAFEGYAVTYTVNGNVTSGSAFAMPGENVTIGYTYRSNGQACTVVAVYTDEDGTEKTMSISAKALDGSEKNIAAGNYFVGRDITFDHAIYFNGDATLVLKDGCTMNVGTPNNRISGSNDFAAVNFKQPYSFTVYGTSLDDDAAGNLNIYSGTVGLGYNSTQVYYTQYSGNVNVQVNSSVGSSPGIEAKSVSQYGGTLTVKTNYHHAIWTGDDIIIEGGKTTAQGGEGLVTASGSIILGYRRTTDRIFATSYGIGLAGIPGFDCCLKVKAGKTLTDGTNIYRGTLAEVNYSYPINGKTLQPLVPGDANNDGTVDIADVTAIINCINNNPPATFNRAAGNVNGDDKIDIADVTGVINMINKQ